MKNLARRLEEEPVFQEVGTITNVNGTSVFVSTGPTTFDARRAASCLLEPTVGDRALVAGSQSEGMYVIAILERAPETPSVIAHDGDLELRLPRGRFVVAAQDGVDVVSPGDVSVVSGRVNVKASDANVTLGRLTFLGTFIRAEVEKIKLFADTLDSVVERVVARAQRSYRSVAESDQLRAGRIDYVAKKTVAVHGENALVTAEELVKIDAEQIHVG